MLALLPASAAANPATQIIVKRDPGLSAAERRDIRGDAAVRLVGTLPLPRTEVVAVPADELREALRTLNAHPDVVLAVPDRLVHLQSDDPLFPDQWALDNTGQLGGTPEADIDAPDAWSLVPASGPTVGVIDSGVFAAHDDLNGPTFEPDLDPVAPGFDWVDEDEDPDDVLAGHGTHVTGTIVAQRDNQEGLAGVAPDARVLPLRAFDETGTAFTSDIIRAVAFAAGEGIKVVNASFAAQGAIPFEKAAFAAADETLFVIAAGNEHEDNDGPNASYPCAYDLPNILCVAASDQNDEPAVDFTNFGATTVDVFAPGVEIVSTVPAPTTYEYKDGTSMAAPHVTGIAALMLARDPSLSVPVLKTTIMDTVDPMAAAMELSVTDGRVNAHNAVAAVTPDTDGDGIEDLVDNCLEVPNPAQDSVACDGTDDSDGDGVVDSADACRYEPNRHSSIGCPGTSENEDGDAKTDAFDNCPDVSNSDQLDSDHDLIGDACDPDRDGDGKPNGSDNCADVSNSSQADTDRDGVGNACDTTPLGHDNDGDGIRSAYDVCPEDYGTLPNGCPASPPPPATPADGDRDGVADVSDACPGVPAATRNGCPLAQVSGVSAKVRKRGTRRSATIRVATSDVATLRVTVERKKGRRWVRITRRTLVTSRNLARLRVTRLKRGSHRVRISISNSAGSGTSVSKTFRVR